MSYLHLPRLIFTGDFQADVSTVNNDVRHYDNSSFIPNYQKEKTDEAFNGWWNPNGTASFRFLNCFVRSVLLKNGKEYSTEQDDLTVGSFVAGADDNSTGKMLDLDPQMQMTSQLFGVRIRIFNKNQETLLEGEISPVGFRDLQSRQYKPPKNGQPLGASFNSVLKNIIWGPNFEKSSFLKSLHEVTENNMVSVNLTTFGYYYSHADNRFTMGRILGTIGPYFKNEPWLFAPSRRLYGMLLFPSLTNNPDPFSNFTYSNFIVHESGKSITVDLGGSFPVSDPAGTIEKEWKLLMAVSKIPVSIDPSLNPVGIENKDCEIIGEIKYEKGPDWLAKTSGIIDLILNDVSLKLVADHQLLLIKEEAGGKKIIIARESAKGYMIRADQNVQRLDPGDSANVDLYVYQWGRLLPNTEISFDLLPPEDGVGGTGIPNSDKRYPSDPKSEIPTIGIPASALQFNKKAVTDKSGKATLQIKGTDPGNHRNYVDGQIYKITYNISQSKKTDHYDIDLVIIHLRQFYKIPDKPVWKDVKPIWQQFGNLYPIMSKHIIDMNSITEILKRKDILFYAFTRDINDPQYMPVTRDLSANKISALIKWLNNPLVDEEPVLPLVKPISRKKSTKNKISSSEKPNPPDEIRLSKAGSFILSYNIDDPLAITTEIKFLTSEK